MSGVTRFFFFFFFSRLILYRHYESETSCLCSSRAYWQLFIQDEPIDPPTDSRLLEALRYRESQRQMTVRLKPDTSYAASAGSAGEANNEGGATATSGQNRSRPPPRGPYLVRAPWH